MITAIALLLALETLAARPAEGLDLIAEVPFPGRTNASYAFSSSPGKGNSDALIFTISVHVEPDNSEPATFRYSPSSKELNRIEGFLSREQQDCDVGLAVIEPASWDSSQIIEVDSGRVLSKIDARIKRTGILGVEIPEEYSKDARLFDVRTGEVLRTISKHGRGDFYIGAPAWDDGVLRLFVRQATKPDGSSTDGQVLFTMHGRTFDPDKEVELFRAALGFDEIIGNPNNRYFAVAFQTTGACGTPHTQAIWSRLIFKSIMC